MNLKRFAFLAIAVAILSSVVFAQGWVPPVNPNPTGLQTTPYSNAAFSANFNGPVTPSIQTQTNSSEIIYESHLGTVYEGVVVRSVNYNLDVTQANADFYADHDSMPAGDVTSDRSTGAWQGHYYTYLFHTYTEDGVQYTKRVRNIIVNPREVIFIWQIAPTGDNSRDEWLDFEYSLRIK